MKHKYDYQFLTGNTLINASIGRNTKALDMICTFKSCRWTAEEESDLPGLGII